MYELKGVAVHSGASCNSDHYYSFCKVDKKWFCMNDDMVSERTWLLANIILSKIIYGEGHCCSDLHLNYRSPLCQVLKRLAKRHVLFYVPCQSNMEKVSVTNAPLKSSTLTLKPMLKLTTAYLPLHYCRRINRQLQRRKFWVSAWFIITCYYWKFSALPPFQGKKVKTPFPSPSLLFTKKWQTVSSNHDCKMLCGLIQDGSMYLK